MLVNPDTIVLCNHYHYMEAPLILLHFIQTDITVFMLEIYNQFLWLKADLMKYSASYWCY